MILLKGGTIFDGKNILQGTADVLIEGGRVSKIAPSIEKEGVTEIDVSERIICPGFIDIHVHFRDPGFEWREDIQSVQDQKLGGKNSMLNCEYLPVHQVLIYIYNQLFWCTAVYMA